MEEFQHILNLPILTFNQVTITLAKVLSVVGLVILGMAFLLWSARFIRRQMGARGLNPNAVQLVSRAYIIVCLGVLVLMTLDLLNVPLTAFAFISGAVAIGVGFGAQNIINNFISGWILMWERPIKIGDFLEIGEVKGSVEAINTRSTRIRRVDGVHLLIPNSQLLENTVTNWTLVDDLVRTSVRVGVAYGSDVRLTERLIGQAAEEHPDVRRDPAWTVLFDDFGDSSLVFEVNVWVNASGERGLRLIRSDLRFRIDQLFREHEIVIAFPQQDVHLDGELRLCHD